MNTPPPEVELPDKRNEESNRIVEPEPLSSATCPDLPSELELPVRIVSEPESPESVVPVEKLSAPLDAPPCTCGDVKDTWPEECPLTADEVAPL